jgi:AraC family transcriptional regulator of adaptative response / DNA-3-methyladenine glycosylase II
MSPSLEASKDAVRARVIHLFDVSADPRIVTEALGSLAADRPGLRVPGAFDGFEVAVRAVLGQQVSVAAARTLAGRFAAAFGTRVSSPFDSLSTAFPTATRIARTKVEDLATLGILPSRAQTIIDLAKLIASKSVHLAPGVDAEETMAELRSIRGIGEWTAQYIAMRALAWRDAFPHTDLGVMKALKERNPRRILALAEKWRPWRAYAVMHLWAQPDSPRVG